MMSFFYHGVHQWYGIYLNQTYGLDKFKISSLLTLTVIGGLLGQLLGGYLADKKGRAFTCKVGILGLAVSVTALAGHYSFIILGIILFLVSFTWTIGHNGISTVLTDFPNNDRAVLASLNSSIRFVSGGIGFQISALFVTQSFELTFLIIGILILILSIYIERLIFKP